jgi:hypothetical protein
MFDPDNPPSRPRELAPGHAIVLTMRAARGVHVAGVFPDVASMRRFVGSAGLFYTRHDVPINPQRITRSAV